MRSGGLSPDSLQSLLSDYRAGASSRTLAARYGIHRTTVLELLHVHGVERRPRGGLRGMRMRSEDMIQAMIAAYQAGEGTTVLGKRYQLHPVTVTKILRDRGVQIRPARWPIRKAVPVGAVFGASTVVGPADVPYTVSKDGRTRCYRVRVECWSCKRTRDVYESALRAGTSRLCKKCSALQNRVGAIYGDR